jgi:hypothetical protein
MGKLYDSINDQKETIMNCLESEQCDVSSLNEQLELLQTMQQRLVLNTKKTKKCSHLADYDEILLILGNIHECRHIKRGEKFLAFGIKNDTDLNKYLTDYNIFQNN